MKNEPKHFRNMSFEDFVNESDSTKLARIVYLQRDQNKSLKRIENNIVWFFYFSLISIIAGIAITLISML